MSAASFDVLGRDRDLGSAACRPEDFPGRGPHHLPAGEIDQCARRVDPGT